MHIFNSNTVVPNPVLGGHPTVTCAHTSDTPITGASGVFDLKNIQKCVFLRETPGSRLTVTITFSEYV